MQSRCPDLLLDQIEVIEQPFTRRGNVPTTGLGRGDQVIGSDQNSFIFIEAEQQMVGPPFRVDAMFGRHRHRVELQLLAREELLTQGWFGRLSVIRGPDLPS